MDSQERKDKLVRQIYDANLKDSVTVETETTIKVFTCTDIFYKDDVPTGIEKAELQE